MNPPTDRRPDIDATSAPSAASGVDETAAGASRAGVGPGFGPPAAAGEVGTLGPYRVVKELGKGGMGAVYAAIDTRLDRRLALKVMLPQYAADPAARERFLREAKAAARVKHDNVVTVYEADERDGVPYIAMEFLDGYPLDEFLKNKGNPTPAQVLRLAAEAAAGLAAAHRLGLVHRDIKPGNLWLEAPAGRVKVLDFGLAKPVHSEVELTQSGAVVGTPAYMSPEQARGEKVDHRTDLFSLGSLLYRLCTGRLPFPGQTTMAVLMALGMDEPPPVREVNPAVPEELAALVHQLLAKSPAARPQTADEVVKRVRAISLSLAAARARALEQSASQPQVIPSQVGAAPIPVSAHEGNPFADLDATEAESAPDAAPAAERRKPRRQWLVAGGLAALVLAAFGGVVIIIRNRDGSETKIEVPDGASMTVKGKDGKTLAQVGSGAKAPTVADNSADRKAAEYVLSIGGIVRVNGAEPFLKATTELPAERFVLTGVSLVDNKSLTDAGMAQFRECNGLQTIWLHRTGVTDAGLAHLKDLRSLTGIALCDMKVTDSGLAHLKGLTGLTNLTVAGTRVTDVGLAHIKGNKAIVFLDLGGLEVTADGLAYFKDCNELKTLVLQSSKTTDAGLSQFKGCGGLELLDIRNTRVTAKGAADFHAAVPGCRIEHDGGVIEAMGSDRKAAEYVLSLGGEVRVNGATLVKDVADLPPGRFTLTSAGMVAKSVTVEGLAVFRQCRALEFVNLSDTKVTDEGLAHFRDCPALAIVKVRGTPVTDAGLAHLGGCTQLKSLDVHSTVVTDAGLAHLRACKSLSVLHAGETKVSDAGLAHLAAFPALSHLDVHGTAVTDAGLPRLKACGELQEVNLSATKVTDAGLVLLKDSCPKLLQVGLVGTAVTDAGLTHLKGLAGLRILDVRETKVTAKGLADFHAAVPGCVITHDGGVIEPKK